MPYQKCRKSGLNNAGDIGDILGIFEKINDTNTDSYKYRIP